MTSKPGIGRECKNFCFIPPIPERGVKELIDFRQQTTESNIIRGRETNITLKAFANPLTYRRTIASRFLSKTFLLDW